MTSSSFPVGESRLAALYVESIILGIYLMTFVETLHALFYTETRWKRIGEIHKAMAIVAVFMFINIVLGSVTSVYVVWRAYVLSPPGEGEATFLDLTNWAEVLKSIVLLSQTTTGDGLLCTSTTSALITATGFHPYGVAFWASTISLNVITTTLLVWPIWKAARRHDQFAYRSTDSSSLNIMKDVTYVVIESGLLYTVAAFVTFVTFTAKHNSLYIVSSAEVGIAGISFNLIIIRTAQAVRRKQKTLAERHVPFHCEIAEISILPSERTRINGVATPDSDVAEDQTPSTKPETSSQVQDMHLPARKLV
ncbi:hypothetical protein H0H93_007329 [Arthromyces matolae]|nr:hypothetical protein H0H93_007329 [Arthromyces matolae]